MRGLEIFFYFCQFKNKSYEAWGIKDWRRHGGNLRHFEKLLCSIRSGYSLSLQELGPLRQEKLWRHEEGITCLGKCSFGSRSIKTENGVLNLKMCEVLSNHEQQASSDFYSPFHLLWKRGPVSQFPTSPPNAPLLFLSKLTAAVECKGTECRFCSRLCANQFCNLGSSLTLLTLYFLTKSGKNGVWKGAFKSIKYAPANASHQRFPTPGWIPWGTLGGGGSYSRRPIKSESLGDGAQAT